MGNAIVWLTEEESRPTKRSEQIDGNFLRKSKRKFSHKGEKRKREIEKF